MKKLTLLLLLVPFASFAQLPQDDVYGIPQKQKIILSKIDSIPFKNCNKIIIKNDQSADDNFNLIKKSLSDNEIEVLSANNESHQVKSGIISIENTLMPGANYYFMIFTKNNQISIKGYLKSGISTGSFVRIEDNYQVVNWPNPKRRNIIFEKMIELTKNIPGKLFYASDN